MGKISNITILTGAGISAESGIKTFRDAGGLWEGHAVEEVASPEGFAKNPGIVYKFYNLRREHLENPAIQPNEAHRAIAKLQESPHFNVTLITQNVDNLHERGGSKDVWHMHGELMKMRCLFSQKIHDSFPTFDAKTLCPCCQRENSLRPHIVWFGEMPFYLDEAFGLLSNTDLFMSIGTSGLVYPAAQFVAMTPETCRKIEFNLAGTPVSHHFDEKREGPATMTIPAFVNELLAL